MHFPGAICLCGTDGSKEERCKQGPLVQVPTPICRDIPWGQGMSCAYASLIKPRLAMAATTALNLLKLKYHPYFRFDNGLARQLQNGPQSPITFGLGLDRIAVGRDLHLRTGDGLVGRELVQEDGKAILARKHANELLFWRHDDDPRCDRKIERWRLVVIVPLVSMTNGLQAQQGNDQLANQYADA